MGASDDEEELAGLRAARLGTGATQQVSTSYLEEKQRRMTAQTEASRHFFHQPSRGQAAAPGGAWTPAAGEDDEDGPQVVALGEPVAGEGAEDALRGQFPLSFGQRGKAAPSVDAAVAQQKRPSLPASAVLYGPPRPSKAAAATAPAFGPPRPGAAGAAEEQQQEEEDEDMVGPPRPPPEDEEEDAEESGSGARGREKAEEEDGYALPISHEAVLPGHTKAVTACELDHSGSRIITGGLDYGLRMYDFGGMKADLRPFRELEPSEGYPVLALSWSPSGDAFLCVTGSAQARIYDRDGGLRAECLRGDMYIRDPKMTKGHISGLTGGAWHPRDKHTVLTCSEDGTVRAWDAAEAKQKTVIKPTLAKPVRTAVTCCGYSSDGGLIGAGLVDGSLQLWTASGAKLGVSANLGTVLAPAAQMLGRPDWSYVQRASQVARNAHAPGTDISSLAFSQDGRTLASRGLDGTLKLWDLRKFGQPLATFSGLPTSHAQTKVIFSPDEGLLATGVDAEAQEGQGGAVALFDVKRLTLAAKVGMPASVIGLAWHHRLNQIFVGCGDRKSGSTRVLYDPQVSQRGVLVSVARKPRPPSVFDFQPQALEPELGRRKRPRERAAEEAARKHRPDPGLAAGKGKGGQLGATGGTLLTQHLLKQRGALVAVKDMADPRESILRHASKPDPRFASYTAAYAKTQPVPIFAQEEEEEGEEEAGGSGAK